MSFAVARELVVALAVLALLVLASLGYDRWQRMRTEIDALHAFQQSVQVRQAVSDAADAAYGRGKVDKADREAAAGDTIARRERATQEARHEDPDVDAWLRTPIPQRLRDADAATREPGGLAEGGAARR